MVVKSTEDKNSAEKTPASKKKSGTDLKRESLGGYFRESWLELKRVTFPTREETIKSSMWVIVFVICAGAILALFDLAFRYAMFSLLR